MIKHNKIIASIANAIVYFIGFMRLTDITFLKPIFEVKYRSIYTIHIPH